jgi:hypothetical protein
MDRMGNILWRQFAADVFLIALHKPDGCGAGENPFGELCAPLNGLIDCAAIAAGGRPVAFDILGSPIAESKFDASSFYAVGHPLLRMIDYADGYVWFGPVDEIKLVEMIPLADYAADDAKKPEAQAEWQKQADDFANPNKRASWRTLPEWRTRCQGPAGTTK